MPSSDIHLVFELLVASDQHDFFLRLSVFPRFDDRRDNVRDLGACGPLALDEVAEIAIREIGQYRAYGLIGCNCQHFALDLCRGLGVRAEVVVPDDQWAEEAAERGVRVYTVGMGIAKGVGAAMTVAATGAGCVGAAGALLISAHVAAGVAVGSVGALALRSSYKWVCRQHRKGKAGPQTQAADGDGD